MLVAFRKGQRTREAVREVPPKRKTPASDAVYAPAFARVRLVRAWIGVAAATVALSYAFAALLDRVLP